jgi:fructose-bisphosphate aldolase class I
LPWPVGFSYGRAIQQPALSLWDGQPSNVPAAQRAIAGRARNNHDARRGRYTPTAALTPS